jgi:hypothetical protein
VSKVKRETNIELKIEIDNKKHKEGKEIKIACERNN